MVLDQALQRTHPSSVSDVLRLFLHLLHTKHMIYLELARRLIVILQHVFNLCNDSRPGGILGYFTKSSLVTDSGAFFLCLAADNWTIHGQGCDVRLSAR